MPALSERKGKKTRNKGRQRNEWRKHPQRFQTSWQEYADIMISLTSATWASEKNKTAPFHGIYSLNLSYSSFEQKKASSPFRSWLKFIGLQPRTDGEAILGQSYPSSAKLIWQLCIKALINIHFRAAEANWEKISDRSVTRREKMNLWDFFSL